MSRHARWRVTVTWPGDENIVYARPIKSDSRKLPCTVQPHRSHSAASRLVKEIALSLQTTMRQCGFTPQDIDHLKILPPIWKLEAFLAEKLSTTPAYSLSVRFWLRSVCLVSITVEWTDPDDRSNEQTAGIDIAYITDKTADKLGTIDIIGLSTDIGKLADIFDSSSFDFTEMWTFGADNAGDELTTYQNLEDAMSSKKKNQTTTTEDDKTIGEAIPSLDRLLVAVHPRITELFTDEPNPTDEQKADIVKQIYWVIARELDLRSRSIIKTATPVPAIVPSFLASISDPVVADKMISAVCQVQDAVDVLRLSADQSEILNNFDVIIGVVNGFVRQIKDYHADETTSMSTPEKSKRERLIELLSEAKSDEDISDILLAYNGATPVVSERTKQVDAGITKIRDLLAKTGHDWTNEMVLEEIYRILINVIDWLVIDDMVQGNNDELSNPLTADQAAKTRLAVMEFIHDVDIFRRSNHSFAAVASFLDSMGYLAKKHKVVVVTGDGILSDLLEYSKVPAEDRAAVKSQIIKVINREGNLNRTGTSASTCQGFTLSSDRTAQHDHKRVAVRGMLRTYGSVKMQQFCMDCQHVADCKHCNLVLQNRVNDDRPSRSSFDVKVRLIAADMTQPESQQRGEQVRVDSPSDSFSDFGTGRMAKASDERRRKYHLDARRDQIMELRDPDLLLNCFNCTDLPTCEAFAERVEELKNDPFRPVSRGDSRVKNLLDMLEKTHVQSSVAKGQQPEDNDCDQAAHRVLNRLFRRAGR